MLLQLEILLRVVSVAIIVIVPVIWLLRYIIIQYKARHQWNISDEWMDLDQEASIIIDDQIDIWPMSDEFDTPLHEEKDAHIDPVIAALRHEEEQYVSNDESSEDSEDADILTINQEESIVIGESDLTITQEIDIIEIDEDGDGVIDETIIIQTTTASLPSDLAEAKRQKSIDMIQFELRSIKEKGHTSIYEKKLIEARALHPDYLSFSDLLAQHYYDQWEYKKSLGLYRALVVSDSSDDKSWSMVANCYIKLGQWENAQLILEKLTQEKPENPRHWMLLAEVYYNFKEIDKTIDCVRVMVKLRPSNIDYLSTLGQLYHESAYYDLYVQILYRMLEIDPLNHDIKLEIEKYS